VQTPIFYNGEERVDIGDSILFRHSKAGELCERFPVLYRVKKGEIAGVFNISGGWTMLSIKGQKWRNWTGNVEGTPHYTMYPESIQDVVEVVGLARKKGKKIRVVGSGHSFTPLVQTEEILVSLDELKGIANIDAEKMVAEVWAGTKLYDLGKLLEEKGYAQENLGDIDSQSIAGAISTGTHGTGVTFGSLSTQVLRQFYQQVRV